MIPPYMVCGCTITFGIDSFFITISMIDDLKFILKTANEAAKSGENRLRLLENLSKSIQFHANVKQLRILFFANNSAQNEVCTLISKMPIPIFIRRAIGDFLDIYQPKLLIMFLWSVLCISNSMLEMELVE